MAVVQVAVQEGKKSEQEQKTAMSFVKHQCDHLDLVLRFGRYPHRNKVLGRESTKEEAEYMQQGGLDFGTSE